MKELLIMAKSLGGGGSEVALIELINALPEEVYNITLVLLDSDNEYAYRLKKKVNIVQLTFNSSFAKSLVSMYAFPAKVLKKLSVNSFIPSTILIWITTIILLAIISICLYSVYDGNFIRRFFPNYNSGTSFSQVLSVIIASIAALIALHKKK